MLLITIIKWTFIVASVVLSIWIFHSEQEEIRKIRKKGVSKEIIEEFQMQARRWTQLILFIFSAFIIWMLSYDFVVEDVSIENRKLTQELEKISLDYDNLEDNRQRLLKAQNKKTDFAANVQSHYTKVFTNYYMMRKCNLVGEDDVFIINSAMMREIALNDLDKDFRKGIISAAKASYRNLSKDFNCETLHGRNNEMIRDYQSYIVATREVLKSTF